MLSGIRLFNHVKTFNSWQLPHITIQPLIPVVNHKEHIILGSNTSQNRKNRHLQITSQIGIGLNSSACPYQGYGQINGVATLLRNKYASTLRVMSQGSPCCQNCQDYFIVLDICLV